FKENCPDLRNTKVVDVIRELEDYGAVVDVHDPQADAAEARHEYGIEIVDQPRPGQYDAIVLAVSHRQFIEQGSEAIRAFGKPEHVLYDLKYALPMGAADLRL
ncbi:MAG: UDP binding domain-containing protein, partial [Cypionkella sp.]